jgi:serine protease Do
VTMGIVSAKGRADMGIVDYEDFIQTDAAINPGNSGGALINVRGEVVGINTAILSRSGGNMGIGFAIPTNMAVPIIDALRTEGHVTRGWLGVTIQELTADLRVAMKVGDSDGVLISETQADGPGGKAGLKGGDVVTAVDGKAVDSAGRFRNLIAASGAERTVKLTVLRAGKQLSIPVKLGKLPETADAPKVSGADHSNLPEVDGLSLKDLDPELRRRLSVADDVQGAVIVQVTPGSRAAQAQLRPGDVLLSINQQPVSSAVLAKKLYGSAKGPKVLLILRQGARLYVGIK